jgi:molybdopterin converting factor small subunit
MIITLHLGEPFWRQVGRREVTLDLAPGATVADALAALAQAYPALGPELSNAEAAPAVFVDDALAAPASPLAEAARLYVVWPVSGG